MKTAFTPREAQTIERMLTLRSLHHGPACAPVGDWLVKQAKKTWPRFAGLRGPSKTNSKRSWTLISYHHPAQLCWLWSVWFTLFPRWRPLRVWIGESFGQYWITLPFLFELRLHTQSDSSWMLSRAAKHRLRAIADGQLEQARAA